MSPGSAALAEPNYATASKASVDIHHRRVATTDGGATYPMCAG
jgi:hypothetical protein